LQLIVDGFHKTKIFTAKEVKDILYYKMQVIVAQNLNKKGYREADYGKGLYIKWQVATYFLNIKQNLVDIHTFGENSHYINLNFSVKY